MEDLEATPQYKTFNDSLAQLLISNPGFGVNSLSHETSNLEDFSSYLAGEVWPLLPVLIREATYESRETVPDLQTVSLDNCPNSFIDSLISYGLVTDVDDALKFLKNAIEMYVSSACAPPPVWSSTRMKECEICEREVSLTYHHLIPRSTHAKVLKRKWHPESMLNSVAWLCRPCHSAVHHAAGAEELAKNYHTVELLLQREDIQKWRKYAAKQRWGVKRG